MAQNKNLINKITNTIVNDGKDLEQALNKHKCKITSIVGDVIKWIIIIVTSLGTLYPVVVEILSQFGITIPW